MKSWVTIFLLGLFLIVVIYLVLNFSAGRTTFFGKAATAGIFNATNSYIFASPITARLGGEKIRITVFALDDRGRGIPKKNVFVDCRQPTACQSQGISVTEVQPQTDNLGRSLFDIYSSAAGRFELEALVEGVAIPQTVTVVFQ